MKSPPEIHVEVIASETYRCSLSPKVGLAQGIRTTVSAIVFSGGSPADDSGFTDSSPLGEVSRDQSESSKVSEQSQEMGKNSQLLTNSIAITPSPGRCKSDS